MREWGSLALCCGAQARPILEAGCFAHARRKFFELADVEATARRRNHGERASHIYPIALEAVQRIDALFDVERAVNGARGHSQTPVRLLASRRLSNHRSDTAPAASTNLSLCTMNEDRT
jgi:Transposase IS66 family